MNITSEQVIELNRELKGLITEKVPLLSKYLLWKLFREISKEYKDLNDIYSIWEHLDKGRSFQEFITSNKDFEKMAINIKDFAFTKSDFTCVDISKYPMFNILYTKI